MSLFAKFSLVSSFGFLALSSSVALAATPTPTSTATPGATSTPPPQQISSFLGPAWLNGRASSGPITANIGGALCSEPSTSVVPADALLPIFTVEVLSADVKPGCGQEGAAVTFFVQGQQASQTGVWHAGGSQVLTLIAGTPFARFGGTTTLARTASESLVPFVNAQACGYDIGGGFVDPEHNYDAVVFSNAQQPGCGAEGSAVTFKILDTQGNVISTASETGVWHVWDGVTPPQRLTLTFTSGIKIGSVGTGDAGRTGMPFLPLAAGLCAAGVVAITASLRLLSRKAMR